MSERLYRLANITEGEADVLVGGKRIGTVQYQEHRWNLTRVVVDREWRAFRESDRSLHKGFATRSEAAEWLARNPA